MFESCLDEENDKIKEISELHLWSIIIDFSPILAVKLKKVLLINEIKWIHAELVSEKFLPSEKEKIMLCLSRVVLFSWSGLCFFLSFLQLYPKFKPMSNFP